MIPELSDPKPSPAEFTVARRLTGQGRSAVAVVQVLGPNALSAIGTHFKAASNTDWRTGQIRFGQWHGGRSDSGEDVVVTPISDDQFEVHCHGGIAAVGRIMDDLSGSGVHCDTSQVSPKMGANLLIREATDCLIHCTTKRTAGYAATQVRAGLARWATDALDQLESDSQAAVASLAQQVDQILHHAKWSTRLCDPFRVVLCGPANVGKSSLVNAIVGYQRSITYDQPGTTRDVLWTSTTLDGLPIRLADTAGLRQLVESESNVISSDDRIEMSGIEHAQKVLAKADLLIEVTDLPNWKAATADSDSGDAWNVDAFLPPKSASADGPSIIRLVNKIDLNNDARNTPMTLDRKDSVLWVSATTGQGLDALCQQIVGKLVHQFPSIDQPLAINPRQAQWLARLRPDQRPQQFRETLNALLMG
ncbi:tRNA modification GTPase MnmE [Crateriforma conspicua]|uniref:tRNA modification GTPase MnmE n=1 Tax=Crateriforma conspicua TaxID=2527996 RepID=A0A5C5Y3L9_9PLAN|nr:tRNA modification GTPase MnmE [Crateriforma conspicua]